MNTKLLTYDKLNTYLDNLLTCDALELILLPEDASGRLYIPYMMNDALENYFVFENCQFTGTFSKTLSSGTTYEIIPKSTDTEKNALIFHKTDGEILTIWFSACHQVTAYYQYHRIGHFWVKGQEHWRRLVYIIGTLHEKYTYLGPEACNDQASESYAIRDGGTPFYHLRIRIRKFSIQNPRYGHTRSAA